LSCYEARLFFYSKIKMYEEVDYEYEKVDVVLPANATMSTSDTSKVRLPEGKVVAMGAIVAGDTENRIINLSVLDNNNEVIRPCDVRFSAKTAGGNFKESLRPVAFIGGRYYEARLVALAPSATETVTVQVLFMIQKPITN
jgi:hypothetical protein